MNRIKKIKVKVKEKPWQFFITMCCFLLLSVLICGSILLQNLRVRSMSKEQKDVLMKETGALRDNMESEIHQLKASLAEKENTLTESEEILKELSESYSTTLETHLPGEIQKLTDHMAALKEDIYTSQTTIQTIEKEIRDNSDETGDTLSAAVNEMTETVRSIDKDMDGSLDTMQEIIENLKGQNDKDTEELSAKLSEVEKKLSDKTESGVSETSRLLDEFAKDYNSRNDHLVKQVDQKLTDQNSKMAEDQKTILSNVGSLKEGNDQIAGKLDTYYSNIEQSNETLRQELAAMGEKLSLVFQSVSNGKQILASALLTKGINLSEGASFEDIKNAILNVDQTLVLDGDAIQGDVEYEYHYHVDGQGNRTDSLVLPTAEGCFTVPVEHVHTGSAETGGGCYGTPIRHSHSGVRTMFGGCYTVVDGIIPGCEYEERDIKRESGKRCPKCGSSMFYKADSYNPADQTYLYICYSENLPSLGTRYGLGCGKEQGQIVGYEMDCNKTEKTIDSYAPGCGMAHGQVTKIIISLDPNK